MSVSVLKARLPGYRPTGGMVECLLLRPADSPETTWRCLLKPGGKTAKTGIFGIDGEYSAKVIESLPSGEYLVTFELSHDSNPTALAQRIGSLPLPLINDLQTLQMRNATRPFMRMMKNGPP